MYDPRGTAFASPNHGGLTPAAPGRTCVRISPKSPFPRRLNTVQPRAGGVSPPWVHYRHCTDVRERTDGGLPRLCGSVPANAFPQPRRADERRSWSCIRSTPNSIRFSRHSDRVTEPRRAHARRSWLNVRLCIAKIAISPVAEHCTIPRSNTVPSGRVTQSKPPAGHHAIRQGNTMQSRYRTPCHSAAEHRAIRRASTVQP